MYLLSVLLPESFDCIALYFLKVFLVAVLAGSCACIGLQLSTCIGLQFSALEVCGVGVMGLGFRFLRLLP